MARFQGNIHQTSDRIGATVLFIILLIFVLLLAWWLLNPVGFADTAHNLGIQITAPTR